MIARLRTRATRVQSKATLRWRVAWVMKLCKESSSICAAIDRAPERPRTVPRNPSAGMAQAR